MEDGQRVTIREVRCIRCGTAYAVTEWPRGCPRCFEEGRPSAVAPALDLSVIDPAALKETWTTAGRGMWRFHHLLPVPVEDAVSLEEGGTPLLRLRTLEDEFGIGALWVKDERRNPTGSFKDRFFSVCLSRARSQGAEVVAIASSGNGGASAAAYAAAAGITCVVITTPSIAPAWRAAIAMTGARLVAARSGAERWKLLQTGVEALNWYPLTNYVTPPAGSNWYGIQGYKTIAYEIAMSLDWDVPDWVVVPTSRGDGLFGIWRGFVELAELGLTRSVPRMVAAERFPSLTVALQQGLDYPPTVESEPTQAVSIGNDTATYQSLHTLRASQGVAVACSDADMRAGVRALGREGIFAELSAAASIAAVKGLVERGLADRSARIVAVVTASGLTDPGAALGDAEPLEPIPPTVDALRAAVLG